MSNGRGMVELYKTWVSFYKNEFQSLYGKIPSHNRFLFNVKYIANYVDQILTLNPKETV